MDVSRDISISGETARPAVVLVASDSEWSARALEALLDPHGAAVLRAPTEEQLVPMAVSTRPDAIFLEHREPYFSAVDACQRLHADARFDLATPIIVASASPVDRAQRLAIYGAGAWEQCIHPLDGELLLRQLRTFVGIKRRIDHWREASLLDVDSGLYSTRGIMQRAREISADVLRRRTSLACAAMSIEFDPPVTDDELHARALNAAAKRLHDEWASCARESDVLGRLGAAEFGLMAPATDDAGATTLLQRLRERVEASPIVIAGMARRLRMRTEQAAVADYSTTPTDALELLRAASRALHQAIGSAVRLSRPGTAEERTT